LQFEDYLMKDWFTLSLSTKLISISVITAGSTHSHTECN